jgi:hypothetical protein
MFMSGLVAKSRTDGARGARISGHYSLGFKAFGAGAAGQATSALYARAVILGSGIVGQFNKLGDYTNRAKCLRGLVTGALFSPEIGGKRQSETRSLITLD